MSQRSFFRKLAVLMAGAFLLTAGPAAAQSSTYSNHPSLKRNPNQSYKAVKRPAPNRTNNTAASGLINQTQNRPTQQQNQQSQQTQCEPSHQSNYRYNNYNGYGIPVYPGPDAPLPQGTYYDPYGYYNNGYNNNGGYYNNGYYNNGYYNNGYTNQTGSGPGSGFPPFERY